MEKIFYAKTNAYPSSEAAARQILLSHFRKIDCAIAHTSNGKPFLQDEEKLFFSVSHTRESLFIAFADEQIGLDAEPLSRRPRYAAILQKFSESERAEIRNSHDFLRHWTAKESAIKYLGGTLIKDLRSLEYVGGKLLYRGEPFPVRLSQTEWQGHFLSVCCARDFSNAEYLPF